MRVSRAPVPFLLLLLAPLPAGAQQVVTSARPDRVEVTVYRAPRRPANEPFELEWLRGYALISETRRITLPAGESEIRFVGVAGGILPQSAIVRGFPQGIVERNRDALLLSPDSLLDRSLGRRVLLRRTSRATGAVREQDAVVRSGADGAVVLQTAEGFEALRCTGQAETLTYDQVPAGLSARPTLSVRARSSAPVTATVTLAYLADGFDWQANYIATLAPDGRHIELFAWLTLANGDETSFAEANTQAVAGRLNRETSDEGDRRPGIRRVQIDEDGNSTFDDDDSDAHELRLQCWPQGTTGSFFALPPGESEQLVLQSRFRLGGRVGVLAGADDESAIVVTGTRAVQEELGDLKLYRIPEPVTVAARSQKQVAFLQQPRVRVDTVYRVRMEASYDEERDSARRILVTRNRSADGLGVPLPGGTLQLFTPRAGGPILLGEGGVRDYAVGEDVEISLDDAPGIATRLEEQDDDGDTLPANTEAFRVTVTNDRPEPIRYELELQLDEDEELRPQGARLARRNGMPLWRVTVPANGNATLRYRVIERDES